MSIGNALLDVFEFSAPPPDPMGLVRAWFDSARAHNVREPGALALATADASGRAHNHIVQVLDTRYTGLVFSTETTSTRGRQLAEREWASGVVYWREIGRQLIISGPTRPLTVGESERLWGERPLGVGPTSVITEQGDVFRSEYALLRKASGLSVEEQDLPRPSVWRGYLLEPEVVEFWQADPGRMHQRLRYGLTSLGWRSDRLQP